jgi:hypothetical protein
VIEIITLEAIYSSKKVPLYPEERRGYEFIINHMSAYSIDSTTKSMMVGSEIIGGKSYLGKSTLL